MAEHDQDNDEYKFDEFDTMDTDSMGEDEPTLNESSSGGGALPPPPKKDVKRNALIVVGAIGVLYIIYKVFGAIYSGPKTPEKPQIPTITQAPVQPVVVATPTVQPVVAPVDSELKQKVADIELNEQGIKSEVGTIKDQVNTVDTNINNLNNQISKLNQAVTDLSAQVAKQSSVISVLMERAKPKPVRRVRTSVEFPTIKYNIQAVIPGRAWLIGSNGSTLTVRAGTKIRGYGVVKLIDSIQGRVITSSGRIIMFGQDDS